MTQGLLWMIAVCCVCFPALSAEEEPASEAPPAKPEIYTYQEEHDPNGIGKFYQGREIAHVMSFRGAEWLERPERESEEQLSKLIAALSLKPGLVVADIGAGSGVITMLLAEGVGPTGKVLAVDIQEEMLLLLSKKVKQRKLKNVEMVLGRVQSPELPKDTVDLIVLVDVYHEFNFPYEMTQAMVASLKPGGRIAFVEYRKEDPAVPIKEIHKMSEAQVKKEMSSPEFDLEWVETVGTLPRQHVVIFRRRATN